MTATFEWDEFNGAGQDQTHGISNCNWGAVDSYNLDINLEANKISRGGNSYAKYIAGHFSGAFNQIGPNGKFWGSSGFPLDAELDIKAGLPNSYAEPVTTDTGDSDIPENEGSALAVQFGWTTALATANNCGPDPATSEAYTELIRTQLQTTASASTGAIGTKTMSLKYDES